MKQKTKWSLNYKPEQVHTKKRRKENEIIPQAMKQMYIVLCIYNCISQDTNC